MPPTKKPCEPANYKLKLRLAVQYAVKDRSGMPDRLLFRRWVNAALMESAEIVIRIVDLPEGEALNRDFRGKQSATNVLTFIYGDLPCAGDIVLCAPIVSREAQQQHKNLVAHYAHLTVHGVLHLQGYDHIDEEDAVIMESLETEIITRLGYADPYSVP
ncbi:rRNA maturation RNase YbeY [Nitrosomonas halophila]|uniref:Endoribonuclease YbeY n=1 Tax=Nitrosomonas halophila TaxID=44576 RepID=A0A1H3EQ42_9PROT|nr:rRNA maturation RNase YbeY [Nitrosomonas halophila]SDX80677.1 probable rRNA maturation factor [Nitrosomonas halophila]